MRLSSAIKNMVPPFIREQVRARRTRNAIEVFNTEWNEAATAPRPHQQRPPFERILLIPPDPGTLVGALGDDAMITSAIETAQARHPGVQVDALTGTDAASDFARCRGITPIQIWQDVNFVSAFQKQLSSTRYDAVAAFGADIMDGYHDFLASAKIVSAVDLASRQGIPSTIFGFSFNGTPDQRLKAVFNRADDRIVFNLRDEVSYARFQDFSSAKSRIVADCAFLLKPLPIESDLEAWINQQRALGRKVIGLNIHAMLFRDASASQIQAIIDRTAAALERADPATAFLFLPHDYRKLFADGICLAPIYDKIASSIGDRVRYLDGVHRAGALKGIAGRLDGVVCARMHLAIAALGMGIPTLCITYQDKFEGLFGHFELPEWLLLSPDAFISGDLPGALNRFVDETSSLRQLVRERLPPVMALAEENLQTVL